ncbi:MAG: hypothetical protein ABIV28_02040 [Longimicrobiales bacterium]
MSPKFMICAALLVRGTSVCAQNPAPAGMQATVALQPALFADSLAGLHDTVAVRNLGRSSEPANDKSAGEQHLRYALIEKRLFELTDDDDARKRAQHSFDKAKDQDERNSWAHFGYGWALTHGPEFKSSFIRFVPGVATMSALGGIFGLDAAARAKRSLQRALDIDPAFEPAVLELSRLALLTKMPKDVAAAASASRKAIGAGRATAGIYTQLAELETLRGNGQAAAEAARAGMKLRDDGKAKRALGIALLALNMEEDAGAASYLEGLSATAFSDSALLSTYLSDVAPLLVDVDRGVLKNLPANETAQWLSGFWERSAAKSARTVPRRLAEHFRRMQYALAHYQRTSKFGVRGGSAFIIDGDNHRLPFDDRGLIYIRFGKPDVRISTPPGEMSPPPNESWIYTVEGDVEMFHFHKFPGTSEWALSSLEPCDPLFLKFGQIESDRGSNRLLSINTQSPPNGGIGASTRYIDYLQERAKFDPRISTYMIRCNAALTDLDMIASAVDRTANIDPDPREAAKARLFGPEGGWPFTGGTLGELRNDAKIMEQRDRTKARAALEADEARPKFEMPLQSIAQIYAFRGTEQSTALTTAILIPGQRFTPSSKDGVMVYPLSLSLILIDSATGRIRRADSKPMFRADQSVQKGHWFRATLDMESAPMRKASYRVVVENSLMASEGDIRSGSQNIPSFVGDALMVSDLVIGEPGDGRWKRGKTVINPIPSHQVERGKQFKLFYEIYNLMPGAKYRTSIEVTPKESGGITGAIKSVFGKRRGVEFHFDDVASSSSDMYGLQQLRSIGADLDPGQYDISVTITNVDTQVVATRKAKLIVLGPKEMKE